MRTLKWLVLFVVAIWFAGEAVAQNPKGKKQAPAIQKNGNQVGQVQKGIDGNNKFAGKAFPANKGNLRKRLQNGGATIRRLPGIVDSGEGDVVATIMLFLDIDQDNKISQSEAPKKLMMRWDAIDTNADGFLDPVEIKTIVMQFAGGNGDSVIVGSPANNRRPGKFTDKAAIGNDKLKDKNKGKGKGKE